MLRNTEQSLTNKRRRNVKKAPKSWFNKQLLDQRKIMKNRGQNWLKYKESHQWTAFKRERKLLQQYDQIPQKTQPIQ